MAADSMFEFYKLFFLLLVTSFTKRKKTTFA